MLEMPEKDNIINTIIRLMEQTENFVDKDGADKKVYVLSSVKIIIGDKSYEQYYYFISMFIDFTINVSKGQKLNLNQKKYCCLNI
jgi:hypothetical protein